MKDRRKEWYEINDEYEYRFEPGDKVKSKEFINNNFSKRYMYGEVIRLDVVAQWKVTEVFHGWRIFGKRKISYQAIPPIYMVKFENGDVLPIYEDNLEFNE